MVALSEIPQVFWGVCLEPGKRYTQTPEHAFHISMAALQPDSTNHNAVQVRIENKQADFLLCTLVQNKIYQQPLDLNINEGENVTFYINGSGKVYLSGYLLMDDDEEENSDAETESSGEGDHAGQYLSSGEEEGSDSENSDDGDFIDNSIQQIPEEAYRRLELEMNSSDDSDDEDYDECDDNSDSEDNTDSDDLSNDDSDEYDDVSDMSDIDLEEVRKFQEVLSKKRKISQETPKSSKKAKVSSSGSSTPQTVEKKKKRQDSLHENSPKMSPTQTPKIEKKNKKAKEEHSAKATPSKKSKSPVKAVKSPVKEGEMTSKGKTPSKKAENGKPSPKEVLKNGIGVTELVTGTGEMARKHMPVCVYYFGKLENGIPFDSCLDGKPFLFKLGAGRVIKGWDIGVQGMHVGGKRQLRIPAKYAYGNKQAGDIPPNSTLVFEVELKAVGDEAHKLHYGKDYKPASGKRRESKSPKAKIRNHFSPKWDKK